MSATPAWKVRPALVDDAVGMARVSVSAWRKAYAGMISDARLAALSIEERAARWRERLGDATNPARSFVAEQIGAIAGFVSVGPARDDDVDAARVAELWAIYVDPVLWGKGVGEALYARAVEELRARGASELVLWVLRDNARARRFYERHGLQVDGAEKAPVEEGETLAHVRYRGKL